MTEDNFTTNTAGIPAASRHNVDKNLGDRIEPDVRAKHSGSLPEATKR